MLSSHRCACHIPVLVVFIFAVFIFLTFVGLSNSCAHYICALITFIICMCVTYVHFLHYTLVTIVMIIVIDNFRDQI